jgi:predicted alpha/beta superfamily hydrolase
MGPCFFNMPRPDRMLPSLATPTISTDLRLHENFASQFLPGARNLVVYCPPGYDDQPDRRFSVLYLHDGQNLFDPNTAFIQGKDWMADETADDFTKRGVIEPLIMVGIYNTGEQRINEYTPWPDPKLGGGHADLYGRTLVEEIKPFIDRNYRTLNGPMNTGLGGSSLGGLVTLYLGMHYPAVFGKLAVLSPSVWWDNRLIIDYIASITPKPRLKIWLDMGTSEGGMTLEDAEKLHEALLSKGWVEGQDLRFVEVEGAQHNETAWSARVGPFLEFLFPAVNGRGEL